MYKVFFLDDVKFSKGNEHSPRLTMLSKTQGHLLLILSKINFSKNKEHENQSNPQNQDKNHSLKIVCIRIISNHGNFHRDSTAKTQIGRYEIN